MRTVVCWCVLTCILVSTAHAQERVSAVPDVVSYGTALVNPAIAAYQAARGEQRWCHLGQLALSELIGNGSALAIKRVVVSPRPCVGCDTRGMPSGHAMNATIGVSRHWSYGVSFAVGTAELRTAAHRHTPWQVAAGLALGGVSEWAGQTLVRCR